jgi:uncharacterized protein YbjT (DUF2867 family)
LVPLIVLARDAVTYLLIWQVGSVRSADHRDVLRHGYHAGAKILRSTQFFEFLGAVAQAGTVDRTVHLSPALFQPIASEDVVAVLADIAVGAPVNDTIEVAGPDRLPMDELVRRYLGASGDSREVVADVRARYFGTTLSDRSLTPGPGPRIGSIPFDEWLRRTVPRR